MVIKDITRPATKRGVRGIPDTDVLLYQPIIMLVSCKIRCRMLLKYF